MYQPAMEEGAPSWLLRRLTKARDKKEVKPFAIVSIIRNYLLSWQYNNMLLHLMCVGFFRAIFICFLELQIRCIHQHV